MGGMCIGSIGLARFVSASHHPLKVYAYLELGIGAFGLLVLWLLGVKVPDAWAGVPVAQAYSPVARLAAERAVQVAAPAVAAGS